MAKKTKDKIYHFSTIGHTGIVQGQSKKEAMSAVRNRFGLAKDVSIELRKRVKNLHGIANVLHYASDTPKENITMMGGIPMTGIGSGGTSNEKDAGDKEVQSQA